MNSTRTTGDLSAKVAVYRNPVAILEVFTGSFWSGKMSICDNELLVSMYFFY